MSQATRLLLVLVASTAALLGCAWRGGCVPTWVPEVAPTPSTVGPLKVLESRPDVAGYQRGCGKGEGCVFGPAWSDDVSVQFGRSGCDQRSDVMREELRDVEVKEGTRGCVPLRGILVDRYSGAVVPYERAHGSNIQVDHVVALSLAWDLGAAQWPIERRRDFAGDPLNLVVTTAKMNGSKGSKGPSRWQPPTAAGRCFYADRFMAVTTKYELPIVRADLVAVEQMQRRCPVEPPPSG